MSSNGIILGEFNNRFMVQPTDSKLPNRNHFIVGGPGSFKTQSYVITNVLNERDCSLVITDPKGEVYEKTAAIKEKQGYEVRVINFMNMEKSDRYNSFDYVNKDIQASTVANAFVAAKNNPDKKDVWYLSQMSLLKSLILYAKYEFPVENRNMEGILDFLQEFDPEEDEEGVSELDEQFMRLERRHPARRAYELGFKKSEERTRTSILLSLLTTIGDFVDDEVAAFTNCSDFYLGDVGTRKIALYVIIPVMDDTWEGLINLFFTQMFNELYQVGAKNGAKLPQPVFFILDEFPNLGKFKGYEEFLATCRGYGIGVATIVQNITQLQAIYGKEKAESILGNCAVKICLGGVNETSAKYFSDLMDKATVKVETGSVSHSKGKNESNSSSDSYSFTSRSLKTAGEILTMHPDESIVIISGKHPIIAKKAKQFELFPGATELFPISQMNYESSMSSEVIEDYKAKQKQYEEYITERSQSREKLQEEYEKEKQAEKEKQEQDITDEAAAFFFNEEPENEEEQSSNATDFFFDNFEEDELEEKAN
ncbi:conjugal transfer protein [Bacilli bacterium]|nr:conjugal transfer protein [Bacilli bacterium VT-13-104]PZD83155.1 conjugal transfer protein [Bacilli bacterium]PZD84298.1 conjugal transfer protein [Bacilli bacterium]PZD86312.1 conjugal transfer protein [Bacilli bacterium]RCO04310.1 conjugal transfer protein [Bacilli bacterium]